MAFAAEIKKDFRKLVEQNRLAQAYIFFGHESDSEKFLFARELANYLERKKWAANDKILIDALFIDAQKEAGIDVVRAASQFLWQKPAVSSRRTLVINGAEHLTLPAENAILKISEEPPPHALIILIIRDPEVLKPALVSRFQKVFITSDSKGKIPDLREVEIFLKSPANKKKELIKQLADDEEALGNFITALIAKLQKDPVKNWPALKVLLERWTFINDFNTNKRLQLEAALLNI